MKTNKLILLGLICLTVAMPTTAQNRNEKKARTERAVKEAIAAKQYKYLSCFCKRALANL